ncbi:MAG: hypothetical protein JO323_10700 [Acidobacteriia bacterium]|nr:hypothetical protein [Terriglobia bacterium]
MNNAARKAPSNLSIAFILALTLLRPGLWAAEPPSNLAKLAAHRETETEAERSEYLYRQTVTIEELDNRGARRGSYKEVREVVFSPLAERSEELLGPPENTLRNLQLTAEDFRDIRDIQPLVLTEDRLWNYETRFRGEETIDETDCWVLQARPRQLFPSQRMFDGLLWIDKEGYNVIRMQGQAVPQIITRTSENLFPRFTTIRKPIDGKHWFPTETYADDVLPFRTGEQRIRLRIAYSNYRRFGADSVFKPH